MPPRAPDLYGHPPLRLPYVHVPSMQLAPDCDPCRQYSSSGSVLCVTPERVVHSTRMGTCDLGFSLTDNWCVIWDPLLVAYLYCLGLRCPTSPHCLVASRYILMTDVWPLLAPWRTCFARYWPALLVRPAYVAPTLPVVSQRLGTGRYKFFDVLLAM